MDWILPEFQSLPTESAETPPLSANPALQLPGQAGREQAAKISIPGGLVGLDEPLKALIRKLHEAKRLAIVGMGGVGKSTLARVLYENVWRRFEYTCFLSDVKNFMTSKEDEQRLQRKILKGLSHDGLKVDESFRWEELKGKNVLIVLDDVEHRSQVLVMMESDGFADGSRVIVTSRDRQFLIAEGFQCHSVLPLDAEDSTKLFSMSVFNTDTLLNDHEHTVKKLIERCGGLPLALRVVGKYLSADSRNEVWNDTLERLKLARSLNGNREDELWSILRVSYDSLEEQEQQMFLDVATCFHGEDVEEVKKVWRVCGWIASPYSGLKNLLDKSLVTIEIDPVTRRSCLKMHEVLRDLGRSYIPCSDPEVVWKRVDQ